MTTPTITVGATLQPDGVTLQLEKKLVLPPGRVVVTVRPAEARSGPTMLEVLDRIHREQQQQGRKPMTDGCGLEKSKAKIERGFVNAGPYMETDEPGLYAIGDIVAGLPQLAHAAMMEGIAAVTHIAGKQPPPIVKTCIPNATYCEPQIGSIGLTEKQARDAGHDVKVGKFPFVGNSKATIVDAHDGFVKVVADAKHGEILGVHIIGPYATEIIAEAVTAIELEATIEELMFTIHAHPTVAEALLDGFSSVEGMAVNV